MKHITLGITSYNRPDLTIEAFEKLLDDERVSEIVIVDDHSTEHNYTKLMENIDRLGERAAKVRLYRNEKNMGAHGNNRRVAIFSKNERVIIGDSDNVYDKPYIDAIYSVEWERNVMFYPSFAEPKFDYTEFAGMRIDKNSVKGIVDKPIFECFMNTGNHCVDRSEYLETWEDHSEILAANSIWFNHLWLKKGNVILPVKGMNYFHRSHEGSLYLQHHEKSGKLSAELRGRIKNLTEKKQGFVTTKLYGRAGNQLFQIATCIGTAIKQAREYKFPSETINPNVWKTYWSEGLHENLRLNGNIENRYKEQHHGYQEIPDLPNLELDGYFQTDKYFSHCRKEVIDVMGFKWELNKGVVGIHVRRGDYLQHTESFPVLPLSYYREAVMYFAAKGYNKFKVFSDDIAWCKANMLHDIFHPAYIIEYSENNDALTDLKLMSNCEHNIIANSTFSWWGAWLNQNPDKIIVAPKQWFKCDNDKDILPENWLRL